MLLSDSTEQGVGSGRRPATWLITWNPEIILDYTGGSIRITEGLKNKEFSLAKVR